METTNFEANQPIYEQQISRLPETFVSNEITVEKVTNLVQPIGACKDLEDIRISDEPIFNRFKDTENIRIKQALSEVEPKVENIRVCLKGILNNDSVLSALSQLEDGREWDRNSIQRALGLYEDPAYKVDRLYYILNKNIDPELVPISIEGYVFSRNLPAEMVDVLYSDTELFTQFIKLITDPKFQKEIYIRLRPGSESYSQEIGNNVNSLIDYWTQTVGSRTDSEEVIERTKSGLEDFFNIHRNYWPQAKEVGGNTIHSIKELTNEVYFQEKNYDRFGQPTGRWYYPSPNEVSLTCLVRYARAVERGKYLLGIFNDVTDLYQEYFPEVYADAEVSGLIIEDPKKPWSNQEPEDVCTDANGVWKSQKRQIVIKSGTIIRSNTAQDISEEEAVYFSGNKVKRWINDIVVMSHEYTHGIYDILVRHKIDITKIKEYKSKADHAINEGFAVLMELLMADNLIANAEKLGLNKQDTRQLQEIKQSRMYSLKKQRNGYTEGTFFILHKVFLDGAGRGNERDIHKGLLAVRDFLGKIDPRITTVVKRDSSEYVKALREGDPQKWIELFSSN